MNKDLTFIIPAAGKSSRFESKKSKIFFIYKKKFLIEHVLEKCLTFSNNIIIISSPQNLYNLKKIIKGYKNNNIKILIQKKPKGMGDAINIALQKVNTKFSAAIWADQIYLNKMTILKTINFFKKTKSLLTFPVFVRKNPYTLVLRDKLKKFDNILQTKEIDYKVRKGESDCGFFVFKTNLIRKYLGLLIKKKMILTIKSNEIDFLSSFKFFKKKGQVTTLKASNLKDTIGINNKKDLI
jgi:bifunctional N-acetylglucosamine-1-phosphate-uridyltransferase/glucosamine-1-phosphate-acetyltransferase GlmU-like protein